MFHQIGHRFCLVVWCFLNNELHTMAILHQLQYHCVVLYWVITFLCIYFLHTKQLFVMILSQGLWLFIYLSVGSLFVCPFLYLIITIFFMKLILFPTMFLRNIYTMVFGLSQTMCGKYNKKFSNIALFNFSCTSFY